MPRDAHDTAGEPLDLASLARAYETRERTPSQVSSGVAARIAARGNDGVWISVTPADALMRAARDVEARRAAGEALPLYGVPFAVKDNIDVAGMPTTAACAAFAYTPDSSAPTVARLVAAGAIVVGKTNMDQFATGLVGVRSPYGVPRNPFDPAYITGGSSSGSAVAVAVGAVSFALGTDTAGSGRIPAGFNNIVGLKPSRGVLSARGVVPACRSLDCVSVFAATCEDAARVAEVARGFDDADPFSHPRAAEVAFAPTPSPPSTPSPFRMGVPPRSQRLFAGDELAAAAFEQALATWARLGGTPIEVDLEPFLEAGKLLYEGPFVAERLEAAGALLAQQPSALLPPLRTILEGALRHDARAAFAAQTRLRALSRRVSPLWSSIDFLLLPTAPTIPTIAAVERDPLGSNAGLGRYSTFTNLLDLSALAVPGGFRGDGLPAGVTLLGPWGADARLASFGSRFHRATSTRVGATVHPIPLLPPIPLSPPRPPSPAAGAEPDIAVAVIGAHLSGQPLNGQLTSAGGRLLRAGTTAPRYQLFALPDTTPPKPGLVRAPGGGGSEIALEIWSLPPAAFGAFVARIPAPLCIGKVELDDGSLVSGFLCEPHAVSGTGARDISAFGGWRAYLASTT